MSEIVLMSPQSNTGLPRNKIRRSVLLASISALMLGTASPVLGQTIWDGSESSDWLDPDNWDGGALPGAVNNVSIDTKTPNPTVLDGVATVNEILIGHTNEGSLTITDQAELSSRFSYIGLAADSFGAVVVTGSGTQWNISENLQVGFYGTGELTIEHGAVVSMAGSAEVGKYAGSDGRVLVTGSGTQWNSSTYIDVGVNGEGELTIANGATVSTTGTAWSNIGANAGSKGTVFITGAGSVRKTSNYVNVGYAGAGILTVADGGTFEAKYIFLANNTGSTGTINIGAASGETAGGVGYLSLVDQKIEFGNGDATLVFNHTDLTETFDAALTLRSFGSGTDMILHEAGWTRYSGDGSGFTGTTEINGGTLSMDGSLGGSVNVNDGGRLEGTGVFSGLLNVNSGGTFAPGNSIGATTVGDIVFNAGSVYEVEVDAAGNSDLIDATGTATIDGGTVTPSGTPGDGLTYTILTAGGGVIGTFDEATRNLFYDYALSYDANNVFLTAEVLNDSFCDVASTSNEAAVACSGLDSLPDTNDVVSAVVALTSEEAGRAAFNKLSGETHPSMKGALLENGQRHVAAVFERVRRAQNQPADATPALGYAPTGVTYGASHSETSTAAFGDLSSAADDNSGFWITGYGFWSDTNATTNTAQMDNELQGLIFGLDRDVNENWRFGVSGGYSRTDMRQDDRSSSGTADSYSLGAYGGYNSGPANFSFGGFYNWHEIDTSRSVAFTGIDQALTASYGARSWQAFAEASYQMQAGDVLLEPLASASYIWLDTDGFSESGGTAALTASSDVQQSVFTTAGFRASMDFGQVKAKAMFGWRHVHGDMIPSSTFSLAGSSAFTVEGAPIAEDSLVTKIGFEASMSDSVSLGAAYLGQFGSGNTAHGAKAMVRMQF